MKSYEYIQLALDLGDLDELNRLSSVGFHVVAFIPDAQANFVLLEREIPPEVAAIRTAIVERNKPSGPL